MPHRSPNAHHFHGAVAKMGERRATIAAESIFTVRGIKLVDRGTKLTTKLYERLMQHKFTEPWQNTIEVEGAVCGSDLRAMAEDILVELPLFARMLADPEERAQTLDLLEVLPLPRPIAFQLTVARDIYPELFKYSVATAMLAGWLGRGPRVLRSDLIMLMSAGLLHDLGMLHVNPILMKPQQGINRADQRQLYSHPLVSALLLKAHKEFDADMVRAVREHHELIDGSGYPSGISGAAISPWGKLVGMAQMVAAMIKPNRSYGELRLSVLLRTNQQHYPKDLVTRVLGLLNRPPEDEEVVTIAHFEDMVPDVATRLSAIDDLLAAWPASLNANFSISLAKRGAMLQAAKQCAHMRLVMHDIGAAPALLTQISPAAFTGPLMIELSLITREMAWQLRALQRQIRRHWTDSTEADYPPALQNWFDRADAAVVNLLEN